MCGITGYYSLKNIFSKQELEQMTRSLIHRGPDAQGIFTHQSVGLGHRRLSIIDLSEQANQPMVSGSGDCTIVFNGEIYNYQKLGKELGISPKTSSDTEIIVEAFEKYGPSFVSRLNGMFAMAIYKKSTNKLYLYRDRLGIKPLFYFIKDNQLAFASELKALTKLAYFQKYKTINPKAVGEFLHLGYIPEPHTIYQNTLKFPKGSYAEFDGNQFNITSYWSPKQKVQSTLIKDFQQAKDRLQELVTSSVKYRLIADVPYGTFLSGGIDSSLVTAIAQKVSNQPLKTFSIGFAESKFNEAQYAQQVARHLNTDHHAFTLTEKDALQLVPDLFEYYDEPFADSSAIPTMLVSKLARSQVTMTLSGDGGDELFLGYGMYQWAERLNKPWIHKNRNLAKLLLKQGNSRYQRIAQMFDYRKTDNRNSHVFSQEQYLFSEKELESLLMNDWKQPITLSLIKPENRELTASETQAFFDLNYYLPDDLLVKVDRASMRFSLEDRVPLLDHRIVEFALNLAPELKIHQGTQKYLLKQMLYDYVPKELFDRPKWGFSIPLNKWLKTDLKYLADCYLSEEKVKAAGLVNSQQVAQLINGYYKQSKTYLYNRIWALICLHQWYFETYKD